MTIEGTKYGMLTAIKFTGRAKNRSIQWLFKCDCGKEVIRFLSPVRTGKTINCGCISNRKGNGNNLTKEKYIEQANIVHNNFYDYKDLVYTKMADILTFKCSIHGEFTQRGSNHLQGRGCNSCGKEGGAYKREEYIIKAKGKLCSLYLIKCYNKEEIFYKVGITTKEIKNRFSGCLMPYNYETIFQYKLDAGSIWDLEKYYLRKFYKYRYKPLINFPGQTECFSISTPIEEITKVLL